jgi:nitroimidazol reductase NimA-like FMN-containing flavoprotein (pyridoxamine 5'-phosphate oxidase superfamily)
MLNNALQLKQILRDLFQSQKLAVLATHNKEQSHASLMAFAATNDLKHLIFATTRTTHKYANLIANSQVALLIDNRSNKEVDFHEAIAVTATGQACEVGVTERNRFLELYLAKHPHLEQFVASPACALFKLGVHKYSIVSRFQNVKELYPRE